MPRTIRASHPESRWHGPSFAIGSNCRASSPAPGTKVYSHFSCLGASPCSGLRLSVEISWTTWSECGCPWGTPRHILTQVPARYCDFEGRLAKLYGAFDADTTDRSDSFYAIRARGKLFSNIRYIIFERGLPLLSNKSGRISDCVEWIKKCVSLVGKILKIIKK